MFSNVFVPDNRKQFLRNTSQTDPYIKFDGHQISTQRFSKTLLKELGFGFTIFVLLKELMLSEKITQNVGIKTLDK